MRGLDFAVCGVIFLLSLECLYLHLGQHFTGLGNMALQCRQALLERLEVMSQPDRADARR